MRIINYLCLFALLVPMTGATVSGQNITLTESGQEEVLGRMGHILDEAGTLDFNQVRQMNFVPLSNPLKSPSYGFDRRTHWFKFEVTNKSTEPDWRMEIPYAPLDRIDFYIQPDSGSVWQHKVNGDIFPISERDLPHRQPIFKFTIKSNRTKIVYLRVKTISSVQVPVIFWTPEEFQIASYKTQLINGLFYGAMFVMVMYQLFLFLSIGDRSTLYYVLTLISMANVIAFFQGYTFLFLHPAHPSFNDDFAALSGPLFVLCSALLTRSFLNVRQFSVTLDNILIVNTTLNLIAGLLMLFFMRQISYMYLHVFVLNHCVIVLTAAAYCLYRKFRPAFYYLLAWATLLLAAVAFTMGNLGLAPGYLGTNYQGLMIGCILQVLLISLALGERWNVLVKENQAAKELELKRGQEEKVRLESEVKLRTLEIQQQKEKLEELNRIKDKLFSVVSHDIKAPLSSLKLSLALTKLNKLSQEEFKTISTEIESHLDQTTNFIQNLLQWAKFQLRGESVKPKRLNMLTMIKETVELLDQNIRQKAISVHANVQANAYVFADQVMVQSVLRNLLTNAAKFTPVGGTITVTGKIKMGEVVISVADTGVGIAAANRESIFTLESLTTPGTQQEAGTGLGLVLCKEFIEKNNGRIWFESEEGKGTTFSFALPEFKEEFNVAQLGPA
jgi:two-component system, sensor histidine kinase LadS